MKAEEIEQIKNAAQGMSLNDVVDCINYLESQLKERDEFLNNTISQIKDGSKPNTENNYHGGYYSATTNILKILTSKINETI